MSFVVAFLVFESVSSEGVKVSDITTLVAGVVGAAIGGAISWAQSRQSSKETLQRDQDSRMSIIENNALSALLKVQRIANSYHTHKMYFWTQLREANARKTLDPQLWQILKSQVGGAETVITFSAEEFIPLHLAGKTGLINECGLLAERLQVVERGMIEYTRLRRELEAILIDHTTKLPDGRFLTEVPKELLRQVSMKTEMLENFIRGLYADIKADDANAKALCLNVSEAFSEHFEKGLRFKMKFVEEDQINGHVPDDGRLPKIHLMQDIHGHRFILRSYE